MSNIFQPHLPKNMYLLTRVKTLNVSSGNIYGSFRSAIEKRTLFPPKETASLARSSRITGRLIAFFSIRWPSTSRLDFMEVFQHINRGTHETEKDERDGGGGGSYECHTCCPNAFPDKLTSDLDSLRDRTPDVPPPTLVL